MTPEQAVELRKPFPSTAIGKLPRITCGACRNSNTKACDSHLKSECKDCGNWITPKHIHLDYVGHADLTDRLLSVDPCWNWEPMSVDERGLPLLDAAGGLWIRLTVCGVSRLGYGHADGKKGGDAFKEVIGDALRNAGMRFGVALDLWKKESPHQDDQPAKEETPSHPPAADPAVIRAQIAGVAKEREYSNDLVAKHFQERMGITINLASPAVLVEYREWLKANEIVVPS